MGALVLRTAEEAKQEVTYQIAYTGVKSLISSTSLRAFTSQCIPTKMKKTRTEGCLWEKTEMTVGDKILTAQVPCNILFRFRVSHPSMKQ